MTLGEVANKLGLEPRSVTADEVELTGGYATDLLSDALAKCKDRTLWVTNQKHQNIIGVAVMLNLAGVVIAGGLEPDDKTLQKALEEKVPLYTIKEGLFDVVGKLYAMGLRSV